jgi:outer membrane biosynthesis protein TonB
MRYCLAALFLSACSVYTPAPLVGQERQDVYAAYVDGINQKLKDVWNPKQAFRDYPHHEIATGKYTSIVFAVIDGEGDLISASAKPSDHEILDREAVRAVTRCGPFTPPPAGLLRRDMVGDKVAGSLKTIIPLQFSVTILGPPGAWTETQYLARDMNDVKITPTELYLEL